MELIRIDPRDPDPELIHRAARAILAGGVVAAPSDTVYGFLARPSHPAACAELGRLKSRPGPFLVLVATWHQARALSRGVGEDTWERLARVWPGPITVVLPAAPGLPGATEDTIALRMPESPLLLAILREVGEPLFSTSANRAGRPAPVSADQVVGEFPDRLTLVLDGGPAPSREPSTLVDLAGAVPRVLRAGAGDPAPLLDPGRGGV
jgi:L-threonylcarbamoyladenylate synthase